MSLQKNKEDFMKKLMLDGELDDLHQNLMAYIKTKLGVDKF
ncbi:MAG: hypothetical protein ACI4T8_00290 [Christensenellales bacterium]